MWMRTRSGACSWLVLLVVPGLAWGWGEDGHYIIAAIAQENLRPEAARAVDELLRDDPDDKSLVAASTWPDRIRSRKEYAWTKPLHYVNVAEGEQAYDPARDCQDGACVVGATERFVQVLRDPGATRDEKRAALKFVVHFVGDVHQPLHVSRAKDRGGNDIKVEFFHDRTNLHRVWDSQLLRRAKKPWKEYAEALGKTITPADRARWTNGTPADWATESYQLAMSNAYAVPADGQLGQEYLERNLPVVEERLKVAGIRLAAVLNGAFALAETQPAVTSQSAVTSQPSGSAAPSPKGE